MKTDGVKTGEKIRICVATSYGATEEPRGPRYAAELARADPRIEVTFIDCLPRGRKPVPSTEFEGLRNLNYRTWQFPWRGSGKPALLIEKIRQRLARAAFERDGSLRAAAFSTRSVGLEKMLLDQKADLYFGFNIDTLLPIANAARANRALFMFDCHEIHAEMAYEQSDLERRMIRAVQHAWLPSCVMVLAASAPAAEFLQRDFGIHDVLPLLNAAPLTELPSCEPKGDFTLYWRNSTVDLGLRGLDDILRAMPKLPADIVLYLQGRPPLSGHNNVSARIDELGIRDRVTILPPYQMKDAVKEALPYTVGLSLESVASINMSLTTSNKFFEYAMAGLAMVSSTTEGLKDIVTSAGLGLLYESGDADDLAQQILKLYNDRHLLAQMRANARAYALSEGNLEFQMKRLREAFCQRVLPLLESKSR